MSKRQSFGEEGRSHKRRKSEGGRPDLDEADRSDRSVFVGNLGYSTQWWALKDHMRKAGNVDSASILTGPDGRSKGCALVTYQNLREAQRAVQELNESELGGRTIYVQPDKRDKDREERPRATNTNAGADKGGDQSFVVFVGNLDFDCSWQDLKDFCRKEAGLAADRADIPKKGWGLLAFGTRKDATKVISRINGKDWKGRRLEARWDRRAETPDDRRYPAAKGGEAAKHQLFVGNLSFECRWQDLKDAFKKFGPVSHTEVCETASGKKTGFGIVVFGERKAAERAMNALDGTDLGGRTISVRWDAKPGKLDAPPAAFAGKPNNGSSSQRKPIPSPKKKVKNPPPQNKPKKTAVEAPQPSLDAALSSGR